MEDHTTAEMEGTGGNGACQAEKASTVVKASGAALEELVTVCLDIYQGVLSTSSLLSSILAWLVRVLEGDS